VHQHNYQVLLFTLQIQQAMVEVALVYIKVPIHQPMLEVVAWVAVVVAYMGQVQQPPKYLPEMVDLEVREVV
jgi:hypothetical protein